MTLLCLDVSSDECRPWIDTGEECLACLWHTLEWSKNKCLHVRWWFTLISYQPFSVYPHQTRNTCNRWWNDDHDFKHFDPNPLSALHWVSVSLPSFSLSHKNVIAFTTLLAKRMILMKWKSPAPRLIPTGFGMCYTFLRWRKQDCLSMEGTMHLSRSGAFSQVQQE